MAVLYLQHTMYHASFYILYHLELGFFFQFLINGFRKLVRVKQMERWQRIICCTRSSILVHLEGGRVGNDQAQDDQEVKLKMLNA